MLCFYVVKINFFYFSYYFIIFFIYKNNIDIYLIIHCSQTKIATSEQTCHNEFMKILKDLNILFNTFFRRQTPNKRKLIRVFQWSRYIKWTDLTSEEKISVKRLLLVPPFAYLIISIFNHNFLFIVILLSGYVLYKKFEKKGIVKK